MCPDQCYSALSQMTNQRLGQAIIKRGATTLTFGRNKQPLNKRNTLLVYGGPSERKKDL